MLLFLVLAGKWTWCIIYCCSDSIPTTPILSSHLITQSPHHLIIPHLITPHLITHTSSPSHPITPHPIITQSSHTSSPSRPITPHPITQSSHTSSPSHLITSSPHHPVTLSPSHLITQSPITQSPIEYLMRSVIGPNMAEFV